MPEPELGDEPGDISSINHSASDSALLADSAEPPAAARPQEPQPGAATQAEPEQQQPQEQQPGADEASGSLPEHHPDSLELALAASISRTSLGSRFRHSEELQRQAHEQSLRIERQRAQQRQALKSASLREEQEAFRRFSASLVERNVRWHRKTQSSPFGADLKAEADRQEERVRAQERAERQQQMRAAKVAKDLRAAQLARALEPTEEDELAKLRAEKRLLIENERNLRASRDVHRKVREVTPLRSLKELAHGVPEHLIVGKFQRTTSLPAL